MNRDDIGRGAFTGLKLAVEPGAERTDGAGGAALQGKSLRNQLHGRGLAVGAGHADQSHRLRRRTVKAAGDAGLKGFQRRYRQRIFRNEGAGRRRRLVQHHGRLGGLLGMQVRQAMCS